MPTMPHMNEHKTPSVSEVTASITSRHEFYLGRSTLWAGEVPWSLGPGGTAILEVLLPHRGFEIHVTDVREGGEPRQHIGEFLS